MVRRVRIEIHLAIVMPLQIAGQQEALAAPPPPPPPPPPAGPTCDSGEDYETVSSRMAAVCCPKDAEHDCSPVPPACLEDCAPEFTSFYVSCGSVQSFLRPCCVCDHVAETWGIWGR